LRVDWIDDVLKGNNTGDEIDGIGRCSRKESSSTDGCDGSGGAVRGGTNGVRGVVTAESPSRWLGIFDSGDENGRENTGRHSGEGSEEYDGGE
jgi:hypothetical protein